jgi:hypothetical protein
MPPRPSTANSASASASGGVHAEARRGSDAESRARSPSSGPHRRALVKTPTVNEHLRERASSLSQGTAPFAAAAAAAAKDAHKERETTEKEADRSADKSPSKHRRGSSARLGEPSASPTSSSERKSKTKA